MPGPHETGDRVATDEENDFCANLWWLAKLQAARALLLLHDGEFHEAGKQVRSLLKVGKIVTGGDAALLYRWIGQGAQHIAAGAARRFASRPGVCEDALEELIVAFSPPWRAREGAAGMLRAELTFALDALEDRVDTKDPEALAKLVFGPELEAPRSNLPARQAFLQVIADHPRPLDTLPTVQLLVEKARRQIESTRLDWTSHKKEQSLEPEAILAAWPVELRPSSLREEIKEAVLGNTAKPEPISEALIRQTREAFAKISNPVGKYLAVDWHVVRFGLPDEPALRSALVLEADLEATRAILALRLHSESFGEPAPTLETLVERKLLREVPRDPFTGKPLGYSLERGRIWSVGPDGDGDGTGPLFDEFDSLEANVWPAPKY